MVLTRRAYKSISRWLPNEVISEIIHTAPRSDLVAICRVSRLFHALGLSLLYRRVELASYASIDRFCSTILGNPTKFAGLVRSVALTGYGWVPDSVVQRLSLCCRRLLKVENISMRRQELISCTIPSLVGCTLSAPERGLWTSTEQEDTIASFLIRHPSLRSIRIDRPGLFEPWPSTAALIPMVNLQRLWAPPMFLSSIRDTRLQEVKLSWRRFEPVGATFATLKSLARSDNSFVCCIDCWDRFSGQIMDSISEHLPHTKTFQMELKFQNELPRGEILASFERCLSRFTGLVFFSFCNLSSPRYSAVFRDQEAEDLFRALVAACSTLRAWRFNEAAWRKLDGAWEKFPLDDFFALAGISWI
ncbi:hypothetical protein K438DRAFT_1811092 [Mycena galopus ATCC 62051]|nr:hypothetical protein K438DRAFT_1811092 [Mycena galopus ATCC 62051]